MKKMTISELWEYLPDWVNYICYNDSVPEVILLFVDEPEKFEGRWDDDLLSKTPYQIIRFIEIDWQCEWQDSLHERPEGLSEFIGPNEGDHVYNETTNQQMVYINGNWIPVKDADPELYTKIRREQQCADPKNSFSFEPALNKDLIIYGVNMRELLDKVDKYFNEFESMQCEIKDMRSLGIKPLACDVEAMQKQIDELSGQHDKLSEQPLDMVPSEINGKINPAWLIRFLKEPYKAISYNPEAGWQAFKTEPYIFCKSYWSDERKPNYVEFFEIDTSLPWEESLFCKEDK